METKVLVACGTPERGFPQLVGHVSLCRGRVFLQVLVVLGATNHAEAVTGGGWERLGGVVVPHPANEGGSTAGPGLHGRGLPCSSRQRAAGTVHLRTCGRCESDGRLGSVGFYDYVGVVHSPDEELHKEPAQPAVVAFRLVQACDLVVLVQGSHVPPTRGKVRVPGGRTFMQN